MLHDDKNGITCELKYDKVKKKYNIIIYLDQLTIFKGISTRMESQSANSMALIAGLLILTESDIGTVDICKLLKYS